MNITGSLTATTLSGNATSADVLSTARLIGGVSFDGSGNITLPGVNTGGNQNTSGTATNADNINIDETNTNGSYQVTFSAQNNSGYNRQYIDTDDGHLVWNPGTATLSGLNISGSSISATTFTGALSGNASSSTQVRVTDNAANTSYALLFSLTGGTGTNRDLYTDGNSAYYIPNQNKLGVGEIACSTIGAAGLTTFGTDSQNCFGARTVSTNAPSGGSDGDIWYKY